MIILLEMVSWCWLALKRVLSSLVLTLESFGTLHYVLEWWTKVDKRCARSACSFLDSRGQFADQIEETQQIVFNLFLS